MIEYRQFKIDHRADDSSRNIEGYGSVFNCPSEDMGFIEFIDAGAITEDTILRSDVFATLNHDTDKILARSKKGVGSLKLSVDSTGLHYQFDAPNTDLGNSVLEYINRGDIDSSSFAFTVAEETWSKENGKAVRHITKVAELFDISPVFQPAYPDAVCHRNKMSDYEKQLAELEINSNDDMDNEKIKELEEEIKRLRALVENDEESDKEEAPVEEAPVEEEEQRAEEEPKEEETPEEESDKPEEEEQKNCDTPKEDEEERKIDTNKSNVITMEKRFSLVAEINKAMVTGQEINLTELNKRAYTVTDEGDDVVEVDKYDILPALRANNVLAAAGAKFLTGLDREIQVPVMTGGQVAWKSELGAAEDGSGSFESITLAPHRLTGKFPISLELLAVDSLDVEAMIRQDIVNAINEKLEATILAADNDGSNATKPEGLKVATLLTNQVSAFDDLCQIEAAVEVENINGACKYILPPSYKASLRSMIKGTNATGMVFENGEVDGTPALVTSNAGAGIYGAFENLYIAQFGDVVIDVVRDVASLANGCVTIVVNAFFDSKVARPEAFQGFTIA